EAGENHAPVIRSVRLEPADPIDGDRVHAIVAVSDQDGDPVELGFEWHISGRPIPSGEASIALEGVTKRDLIEVAVKASDGELQSPTARAEAKVRNRRPTVVGIAIRPQPEVLPGETLVATAQANDPDGDRIEYSYRWQVNGRPQMETGDRFETDSLKKGDAIQAIVVANDGSKDSDELASVVVRVGNAHPEITSVPDGDWTDEGFSYQVRARDPDNDGPLRYSIKTGPKGMRVDSVLGKVVWQPTFDQAGVHPIEIAVTDAAGATSVQIFEITVKAEESAAPPPASRR
ncbi:MAG: hypothetical protein JRE43_08940, partial [Deltaproteobacteria bacterium]|nr:hypothetical protein [Deltaproteobacteria bacterium]